jgi:hypothetical protein
MSVSWTMGVMIPGCGWFPGNVNFRARSGRAREGSLLRELRRALVLLQEVNPGSAGILQRACGADWMVRGDELPCAARGEAPARCHVAAVAGVGWPIPTAASAWAAWRSPGAPSLS